MGSAPRLLAIMGSGETSPTMVKTHRELLARLGPAPAPAVVLDTPFAFQDNAGDIAARAVEYFRDSVGHPLEVVRLRSAEGDPLEQETARQRLRQASYVFSGPGSPSYALRQWRGSDVPAVLAEKLRRGGCVTFASAAALTLGIVTVPVYEIYKAGEEPRWLDGLDLLGEIGISAAVVPHYDNAEGGTHDTRFCYLGERRLARLEAELPPGAFVLGVDEHTALVLDLAACTARVVGLGRVTVRRHGASSEVHAGATLPLDELVSLAGSPAATRGPTPEKPSAAPVSATPEVPARGSPLLEAVARLEAAFEDALGRNDAGDAVRAVLELEDELVAWSRDTLQSDELGRGRAALRGMVVRLGALAENGVRDPAEVVGRFVDVLLAQRTAARAERRWEDADALRDVLAGLGVEISDGRQGTTWRLLS